MGETQHLSTDLPDAYLAAIGRVVVKYNEFEWMFNRCLAQLQFGSWADYSNQAIFFHSSIPQRIAAMETLLTYPNLSSPELREAYKSTLKKVIEVANQKRKFIVHSFWSSDSGVGVVMEMSARGKFCFSGRQVRVTEIDEASKDIETATKALYVAFFGNSSIVAPQEGQ